MSTLREIVKLNQEHGTFTEPSAFNWDGRYRIPTSKVAVAWSPIGWELTFEPYKFIDEDENGNEIEYETGEGELIPDRQGRIAMHMVGDDHVEYFDADELVLIDDDEYCTCCGQIGCHWN